MGIYFLRWTHGNEHIRAHNVVRDTFDAIVRNVSFHVGWEQLHALPSTTFNSSRQQVDIVLTKDGICTLADVVITNPMCADLSQSCIIQGFVAFDAARAKKRNYHNQHPTNQILFLTIEVFGCLHKQADVFLHNCANVIWSQKGPEGPSLSVLVTFLCQRILITL